MIIDRYSNYRKNNGVKKDNDDNDGSGNESEQSKKSTKSKGHKRPQILK